jgi:hypothetical protein
MRTALKGLTNLVSYCDRLTALYFPDSEEGATTPPTNDSSLDGSNTLAVVGSDGA